IRPRLARVQTCRRTPLCAMPARRVPRRYPDPRGAGRALLRVRAAAGPRHPCVSIDRIPRPHRPRAEMRSGHVCAQSCCRLFHDPLPKPHARHGRSRTCRRLPLSVCVRWRAGVQYTMLHSEHPIKQEITGYISRQDCYEKRLSRELSTRLATATACTLPFGADQAMTNGASHQSRYVMNIEPFHQLSAMRLDGLHAHVELPCNILCAAAFGDKLKDLSLTSGEMRQRLICLTDPLHVVVDDLAGDRRAEVGFAAGDGVAVVCAASDGLQCEPQFERGRIFHQVTRNTGAQRLQYILFARVHGQYDD